MCSSVWLTRHSNYSRASRTTVITSTLSLGATTLLINRQFSQLEESLAWSESSMQLAVKKSSTFNTVSVQFHNILIINTDRSTPCSWNHQWLEVSHRAPVDFGISLGWQIDSIVERQLVRLRFDFLWHAPQQPSTQRRLLGGWKAFDLRWHGQNVVDLGNRRG